MKWLAVFLLIPTILYAVDSTFTYGGIGFAGSGDENVHDAFIDNGIGGSNAAKNYGAANSILGSTTTHMLISWGERLKSGFSSVLFCTCGVAAQGSAFQSSTISITEMLRPVYAYIGNNNGTTADAGENNYNLWQETGGTDSSWRTAGAAGASDAGVWNVTSGSSGYDRKSTAMGSGTVAQGAAAGIIKIPCDTAWAGRFLRGDNDEAAIIVRTTAGQPTYWSSNYFNGDTYPFGGTLKIGVRFPDATAITRGTDLTGRYGDRIYEQK